MRASPSSKNFNSSVLGGGTRVVVGIGVISRKIRKKVVLIAVRVRGVRDEDDEEVSVFCSTIVMVFDDHSAAPPFDLHPDVDITDFTPPYSI